MNKKKLGQFSEGVNSVNISLQFFTGVGLKPVPKH